MIVHKLKHTSSQKYETVYKQHDITNLFKDYQYQEIYVWYLQFLKVF